MQSIYEGPTAALHTRSHTDSARAELQIQKLAAYVGSLQHLGENWVHFFVEHLTRGHESIQHDVKARQTRQATTCPPDIFPLHLQDSPDGLPSLSALSLEPRIRQLY